MNNVETYFQELWTVTTNEKQGKEIEKSDSEEQIEIGLGE